MQTHSSLGCSHCTLLARGTVSGGNSIAGMGSSATFCLLSLARWWQDVFVHHRVIVVHCKKNQSQDGISRVHILPSTLALLRPGLNWMFQQDNVSCYTSRAGTRFFFFFNFKNFSNFLLVDSYEQTNVLLA